MFGILDCEPESCAMETCECLEVNRFVSESIY